MPYYFNPAMIRKSLLLLPLMAALSTVSLTSNAAEFHVVVPAPGKTVPYAAIKLELNPTSLPVGWVGDPYAEFDFNTALRITGDPEPDMSQVAWSVYSSALPSGLSLTRDGSLYGTPTEKSESSFHILAQYKTKSALGTYQIAVSDERHLINTAGVRFWEDSAVAQSCSEYRQPTHPYIYAGATGDGLYRIAPNGQAPFDAYCDMASDGGGWTRVVLQYEGSPVVWTGKTNGASYSLAQNQIPAHTSTGFGRDDQATFVDYVDGIYTTGNIPVTVISSAKTGKNYHMFRSNNSLYESHDPEGPFASSDDMPEIIELDWRDTLTLDEIGKRPGFDWAFSPRAMPSNNQGYAFAGAPLYLSSDGFAWSVWVR